MCEHGTNVLMYVPIPAEIAFDGKFRWDWKDVDACLAPMIQALNDAGIYTTNCCCGHGKSNGKIYLHDGRVLEITKDAS